MRRWKAMTAFVALFTLIVSPLYSVNAAPWDDDSDKGTLTITKTVVGGDADASDFTFTLSPKKNGHSGSETYTIAEGETSLTINGVKEGTYTVTEGSYAGYELTATSGTNCEFEDGVGSAEVKDKSSYWDTSSWSWKKVNVPAQDATCNFTNTATTPEGQLTVTKVVVDEHGLGTKTVSDFPLSVGETSVVSGEENTFEAGDYTVSEAGDEDYDASFSGACDAEGGVTVEDDGTHSCTITNTFVNFGTITVVKEVVNSDADASTFNVALNDAAVTLGTPVALLPGAHVITEDAVEGFTLSVSGDGCTLSDGAVTVDLEKGDNITCTLINTFAEEEDEEEEQNEEEDEEQEEEQQPEDGKGLLTVTKIIVDESGLGTKTVSDFSLHAKRKKTGFLQFGYHSPVTMTSGEAQNMTPGLYSVYESDDHDYSAQFGGDCNALGFVDLDEGEHKHCTITNTYTDYGSLVITKIVEGGPYDGQPEAFTFTVKKSHSGTVVAEDVMSGDTTHLAPRWLIAWYEIEESGPSDYEASYSEHCPDGKFWIFEGHTTECTITNTYTGPTPDEGMGLLTLTKTVIDESGLGDKNVDDFTYRARRINEEGGLFGPWTTITPGEPINLEPGDWRIRETDKAGYELAFEGDCVAFNASNADITITEGGYASCHLTNTFTNWGTLIIEKTIEGGEAVAEDFTFTVKRVADDVVVAEGIVPGASTPLLHLGEGQQYSIEEHGPSGYEATSWSNWCQNGIFKMPKQQTKTCTISNTWVGNEEGGGDEEGAATLTLFKSIENNEFGNLEEEDFTLTVTSGEGQAQITLTGHDVDGQGAQFTLAPGTYEIGEQAEENYVLVSIGDGEAESCPIIEGDLLTVEADQEYSCTIVNRYTETRDVTLSLNVEGGDQEDLEGLEFVLEGNENEEEGDHTATGIFRSLASLLVNTVHAALGINVTPGSATPVPYGTYTFMVYGLPSGYSYAFTSGDCDAAGIITIDSADDTLSCMITITASGGGGGGSSSPTSFLQVVTTVVNDDGGSMLPSNVTMTVTGNPASVFGGFASPGITLAFSPGIYAVTSPAMPGYTRSETSTCSGTAANGQFVTCVVTYNDEPAPTPPAPPAPPPPAPPTTPPTPGVLGVTDTDDDAPEPIVLGDTDEDSAPEELPRTGMPVAGLLLPALAFAAAFRKNQE